MAADIEFSPLELVIPLAIAGSIAGVIFLVAKSLEGNTSGKLPPVSEPLPGPDETADAEKTTGPPGRASPQTARATNSPRKPPGPGRLTKNSTAAPKR